jgi:hypothetical protein
VTAPGDTIPRSGGTREIDPRLVQSGNEIERFRPAGFSSELL